MTASETLEIVERALDRPFDQWRRNVHSQCGEDGVIEKLCQLASIEPRYFVEFGAWDGRHLSNCAKLADEGWQGCFIEGNNARYKELEQAYAARDDIIKRNEFVRSSGQQSLDAILDRAGAPERLGVLSIDIDGCDYHVWASLERYRPALCVVEFNPTIPAHVLYVQKDDSEVHRGASLAALDRLSHEKGYALVAATDWNGFFLEQSLCTKHGIPTYSPEEVKPHTYEAALFHGYDGMMLVAGNRELLWHGISYDADALQVLPAELRRFIAAAPTEYQKIFECYLRSRTSQR